MRELSEQETVQTLASVMPAGLDYRSGFVDWGTQEIASFMADRLEDGHYAIVYTGPG